LEAELTAIEFTKTLPSSSMIGVREQTGVFYFPNTSPGGSYHTGYTDALRMKTEI